MIFDMVNNIQSRVNSVTQLMEEQNKSLTAVINQARVIDNLSKGIATTTNEQKTAMRQAQETTESLSHMASELAQANTKIIDFSRVIIEKSEELSRVVKAQ